MIVRNLFLGPILLFLLWTVLGYFEIADPLFLPEPTDVFHELLTLILNGEIIIDLLETLKRIGSAFLLSAIFGIPIGLILGMSKKVYQNLEFLIDFFRSTPATALFPLFILFFGITDQSKIAVAAFSSFLIIIFNTAYGVIHAKTSRRLTAKIMGASPWQLFKWIIFWESLPQTFIGLRSAISLSLVVILVTEMFIGTTNGLGRLIIDFQIVYNTVAMYAVIFLTGFIGYTFNLIFLLIEKHLIHWSGKH